MKAEIEQALAPLVGLPLRTAEREGGMLQLQFGDGGGAGASASGDNGAGEAHGYAGMYALHVSCTWRLTSSEGILTGSGDLFTPVDPDVDPEDFDWEEPGANWCDIRLGALMEATAAAPPRVTGAAADSIGGLQLLLGDLALVVFPDSSHTEHVESEFWRLLPPGASPLVVSSAGVERVDET